MRSPLTIALAVLTTSALRAEQVMSPGDLLCIDSLTLPTRGLLAARAERSGSVQAVVSLKGRDEPPGITLQGDNPILNGEVQVALSLSRFSAKCAGKSITLFFYFTLEDPPTDAVIPPVVRFIPPNRFELTFRRVRANIDAAPTSRPPAGKNVKKN